MKSIKKPVSHDQIAWLALIIIILFFAVIRYRLANVPLERDEGEYVYAGQMILQGIFPYHEIFNMKFPGIYAVYALLLAIFGQTYHGIHVGLLLINSITIIFISLLANKLLNPFGQLFLRLALRFFLFVHKSMAFMPMLNISSFYLQQPVY